MPNAKLSHSQQKHPNSLPKAADKRSEEKEAEAKRARDGRTRKSHAFTATRGSAGERTAPARGQTAQQSERISQNITE